MATAPTQAIEGADAVAIVTEWDAFRALDFARVKADSPRRRCWSTCATSTAPTTCARPGFTYTSIGRD